MDYLIIGAVVGLVMGLTGAGGALVSIPLFITLLGLTLKEATVLSLIVVIIGALINLLTNKDRPNFTLASFLLLFGTIGNWLSTSLKSLIPDWGITALLIVIALYSVWSVWKGGPKVEGGEVQTKFYKIVLTGLFLGIITTLTGLGGGVLLVPILMSIFGYSYNNAVPTSLLAITFISSSSLALQWERAAAVVELKQIIWVALGVFIAAILLKEVLKRLPNNKTEMIRKIVFTIITTYSIGSLIITSM